MHVTGWRSHSGRCPTIQAHAAADWQRRRPASLRQQRILRKLHMMPHAIDSDVLEHVMAAQAAFSTAGLMFASAALGLAGGRRMASASPEDAADRQSASSRISRVLHIPAPSSSGLATSIASSSNAPSSTKDVSVQSASAEAAPALDADGGAAMASSQSDYAATSSSFLSAEQLWEGAWKAFEEPEQKQSLTGRTPQPGNSERGQQLDTQHQSSFPSLAARFFGTRSAPQDRRKRRGAPPEQSIERSGRPDQDVWAKPQLALQGIAPAARVRLLACALASIEKQVSALPDALNTASPEQWRLATQAVTASCAMASARAWIGYVPQGLTEDAQEALQQLAAHDTVAGDPQAPGGAGTRSSFGQLLTGALPSEVQSLLKSSRQPVKSNKSGAVDSEPRELTPLESLQTEKARIHGALVSYLKCGWQASGAVQPSRTESEGESADSSATMLAQSRVDREHRAVAASSKIEGLGATLSAQPQQQHASMSGQPQVVQMRASSDQQNLGSSGMERHASRRAEAMAALEGRQYAMSPGSSAQAGAVQQMPMVLRCGAAVLQDMAVAVADAAADAYLAEAGVSKAASQGSKDPGVAADSWLLVLHPRLTTTRSLERFRNQVAMQRWMEANFGSVAAMYEDRHQLWGFNHKGRLLQRSLPARRAQELGGLTGLRSYYSTALEAFDFLAPLLERLFTRIGDAVSWLLVRLIGRSLGLVYRGVRESLVPRQQRPGGKMGSSPGWAPI